MPERPCLTFTPPHTDPKATAGRCRLCQLALYDGRYQELWGLEVTAPKGGIGTANARGPQSHVGFCANRQSWDWWVKRDGAVAAQGSEKTEAEAWAEVNAALPPPPAGSVRLEVTANGIGDHVMALAVAAGWKAAHPGRPLTLVSKPWCAAWCDLFGGYDELSTSVDDRLPDCWPGGAARGGGHFVEAAARAPWRKLPELRPLPAEALKWAEQYRRAVVLSPFSLASGSSRDWLPSHWRVLEDVLRSEGRRVAVLGSAGDAVRMSAFRTDDKLAGLPPARVAALMREAAVVVSNESGMAHLAGVLGVPAVALAAQLDGKLVHGWYPHSTVLQGPLACSGCRWGGSQFRPACNTLCSSLQAITPEHALSAARTYLDCEWFPDPLLRGHLGKLLVARAAGKAHPDPDRRGTVGAFLKHLERFAGPLVVETGCQRQALDYGAGMSTTLFGLFLRSHGGHLTSLDLSPANVAIARAEAAGLPVDVVETDSRPWLRAYAGPLRYNVHVKNSHG